MSFKRWTIISNFLCFFLGWTLSLFFIVLPYNSQFSDTTPKRELRRESVSRNTVVLILSGVSGVAKRNGLRQTWLRELIRDREEYFFAIGVEGITPKQRTSLVGEQVENGDLLLLPLVDTYQNLTFKLLSSLSHISKQYKFQYLIKADDDTYIVINKLRDELEKAPKHSLYWGYFNGKAPVQVKGKWKETNWFLADRYLPYALGGAYIITSDLVQFVADNRSKLSRYVSEDVSVGTWLSPLNLSRVHDVRFDTGWRPRGCSNEYLAIHKQTPRDMMSFTNRLSKGLSLCEREFTLSPSYNYNWSATPSKCCSVIIN